MSRWKSAEVHDKDWRKNSPRSPHIRTDFMRYHVMRVLARNEGKLVTRGMILDYLIERADPMIKEHHVWRALYWARDNGLVTMSWQRAHWGEIFDKMQNMGRRVLAIWLITPEGITWFKKQKASDFKLAHRRANTATKRKARQPADHGYPEEGSTE